MTVTYNEILSAANMALDRAVAAYKAIHSERVSDEKAKAATAKAWSSVRDAAELVLSSNDDILKKTKFRGIDLRELIKIGIGLIEGSFGSAMNHPNRLGNVLREIEMLLQNVFRSIDIMEISVGFLVDHTETAKPQRPDHAS